MPNLLVVCHPNDRFMTGSYVLHAMLLAMKGTGVGLKVQRHWDERPPADLVIPHIDLTVWPKSLTDFLAHYPNVANRRLTDISKRHISGHLVRQGDSWQGPVIVKTDMNYGGIVDRRHTRNQAKVASGAPGPMTPAAVTPETRPYRRGKYSLFASIGAVPKIVWDDPGLIVERYHAERKGDLYGLRQLFLVGETYAVRQAWGPYPVVKGDSTVERHWLEDPPPPEVLDVVRAHGVEFGKIDYTVVNGQPFVFDIARTPTGTRWIKSNPDVIRRLCQGLAPLLARRSDMHGRDMHAMETTR